MDVGASFGVWLKHRRQALDLTQEALAEKVGCETCRAIALLLSPTAVNDLGRDVRDDKSAKCQRF